MKKCVKCDEFWPIDNFGPSARADDGRLSECRPCVAKYHREYRKGLHTRRDIIICPMCSNEFKALRKTQVTCSKACYDRSKHPKKVVLDLPDGYKQCSCCRSLLENAEFNKRRKSPDGLQGKCKKCAARWQDDNREKRRITWAAHSKKKRYEKYGVTEEYVITYTKSINGKCEICKVKLMAGAGPSSHAVDHNHETGFFRGVLCQPCNSGIGLLKDSPHILRAAAEYLDSKI